MDLAGSIEAAVARKKDGPDATVSPHVRGQPALAVDYAAWAATTDAPVVLFYPRMTRATSVGVYDEHLSARAPVSILALAGPLQKAGYRVHIVESVLQTDYLAQLERLARGALCVGISAIAGHQVHEGYEVSRHLKQTCPDVPIVWGGWFPTMLTRETIEDPHVDIVVRGQGEATFLELVHCLSRKLPLHAVRGIAFKEEGRVVHTPARPVLEMDSLPRMPYEILDMQGHFAAGLQRNGRRTTSYFTSYGCPYQCTFCSNDAVFGPNWHAFSPERTVADLEHLVTTWGVNHVILDDANYFVNTRRVRRICELVIERGLEGKFTWATTGTANVISRMDDETLRLIKRSGCSCVFMGAESASSKLMSIYRKPIKGDQVVRAAELLGRHGIVPDISFVGGVPGEPEGALDETLALIARIYRVNPKAKAFLFFFSPIPGVLLSETPEIKENFKDPPRRLADWADLRMQLSYTDTRMNLPRAYRMKVLRVQRLTYVLSEDRLRRRSYATRLLRWIALFRLQHMVLGVPTLECRLWHWIVARSARPRTAPCRPTPALTAEDGAPVLS